PFLSMTMARFGAEVIKIETPGRGDLIRLNGPFAGPKGVHPTRQTEDDLTMKFLKRSEGVKSVTLNLKDPAGRQMFLDMAKECDVVLENLAPGSMKRLGLGYKDVAAVNPRIVYCSISGYGQEGPYADNPAHDHQIQAMSGMMDVNGDPMGRRRGSRFRWRSSDAALCCVFDTGGTPPSRANRRRPVFGRRDDGCPGDLNVYGADGGNSRARTTGPRWQQCADRPDRPLSTKRRRYRYHPGE
ncbi:MAG: CoA transferase, partial [Pseudomonadota bacterium]|nr:CoA transferase [Pseudomonadota bacterium]